MRLRILTLNTWNTQGPPARIRLINQELRRLSPDLVVFQEVVFDDEINQLEALLDETGLHGSHQRDVLQTEMPYAGKYGGSAIATRWPHQVVEILDSRMAGAMDVPWCTLAATLSIPDEGPLLLIGTTGPWRPEQEYAREQFALALSDLDARHRQSLPTIIAGDFNASTEAASVRFLCGKQSLAGRSAFYHDAWSVAGDGPGYTWTTDNPNGKAEIEKALGQQVHHARIDRILVGSRSNHPDAAAFIRSVTLTFDAPIDGVWVSDHFGVMADIDISGKA